MHRVLIVGWCAYRVSYYLSLANRWTHDLGLVTRVRFDLFPCDILTLRYVYSKAEFVLTPVS